MKQFVEEEQYQAAEEAVKKAKASLKEATAELAEPAQKYSIPREQCFICRSVPGQVRRRPVKRRTPPSPQCVHVGLNPHGLTLQQRWSLTGQFSPTTQSGLTAPRSKYVGERQGGLKHGQAAEETHQLHSPLSGGAESTRAHSLPRVVCVCFFSSSP